MVGEKQSEREVYRYGYGCPCCGPMGRWGAAFWGVALVAVGGTWLLGNLEVIPHDWWRFLLPVALIGWGIATLWTARQARYSDQNWVAR